MSMTIDPSLSPMSIRSNQGIGSSSEIGNIMNQVTKAFRNNESEFGFTLRTPNGPMDFVAHFPKTQGLTQSLSGRIDSLC